jgi:hypothetical protein
LGAAEGAGPSPGGHEGGFDPARDPLARWAFAVLVLACFAAFFVTQRLKHTPTAVQRFERTPTFAPASPLAERREERISFKLASAEAVTVAIVDSNLDTVATLVSDYRLPRYKQFSLRWNGRRGRAARYRMLVSPTGHRSLLAITTGPPAPAGEYRVRVTLEGKGNREVLSPWSFTLVRP